METTNFNSQSVKTYIFDDKMYVYCVNYGDRVKIGRSKNPNKRMKSLSNASGLLFDEIFIMKSCPSLENIAHRKFSKTRIVGEFFKSDFKEVVKFLKENKIEEKNEKKEKYDASWITKLHEKSFNNSIEEEKKEAELINLKDFYDVAIEMIESSLTNESAEQISDDLCVTIEEAQEMLDSDVCEDVQLVTNIKYETAKLIKTKIIEGLHYKEIYMIAKQDIERFSNSMKLE